MEEAISILAVVLAVLAWGYLLAMVRRNPMVLKSSRLGNLYVVTVIALLSTLPIWVIDKGYILAVSFLLAATLWLLTIKAIKRAGQDGRDDCEKS
jgi:hypothetical protein